MHINADFEKIAEAHTSQMDWVASPMKGVSRRMLDRIGDEVARATSIVRYDEKSHFSAHSHGGGEEFLVIDGVFQDEHGDYPVGTYVRNPIGTSHTPASEDGCQIFVKLWQFGSTEKDILRVDTQSLSLTAHPSAEGVAHAVLFQDSNETVEIQQWDPGSHVLVGDAGGAELFVVDGGFVHENKTFEKHDWLRVPKNKSVTLDTGNSGARIWMKTGHLNQINVPSQS